MRGRPQTHRRIFMLLLVSGSILVSGSSSRHLKGSGHPQFSRSTVCKTLFHIAVRALLWRTGIEGRKREGLAVL